MATSLVHLIANICTGHNDPKFLYSNLYVNIKQ